MWVFRISKKQFFLVCFVIISASLQTVENGYAILVSMSLEDLSTKAESIIVGDVIGMESQWEGNRIFTYVTISIEQYVKGKGDSKVTIKVPGGKVGDIVQVVSDIPRFQAGEKTLLFLRNNFSQVVGWQQGKFTIFSNGIAAENTIFNKGIFINRIRSILRMPPLEEEVEAESKSLQSVPYITSIAPSTTASGTKAKPPFGPGGGISDIVITGSNFGSSPGRVTFPTNGTATKDTDKIYSWSDNRIECHIPFDAHSGDVIVYTSDGSSDQYNYIITFATGWVEGFVDDIKWPKPAMGKSILVNENCPDVTKELSSIQAAMNTWSNAGADFAFSYGGPTTKNQAGVDNTNIIAWNYIDDGDTVSFASYWYYSPSGVMVEADIILNTRYSWSTTGEPTKFDIQSLVTHELGHMVPLRDLRGVMDKAKVMYGSVSEGETKKRVLTADDIAGIVYLYSSALTLTSFSINNGSATTCSQIVVLNNAATDNPTHYLASENVNFAGANWQPYSAAPSFNLSPGCGTKTVYLKVKNASSESNVRSDTIQYLQPPALTSFAINNGETYTPSQTITLNNAATCSPTYYMASENSSFSGASWQPYNVSPYFNLSSGDGTKTVYFKVKNDCGESSVMNDTIELSQTITLTSFFINNGSATTYIQTVTLNNTTTDNPTHYLASEDANFAGASWQSYSAAPSFNLSSGCGTKTVYLKVKNANSESNIISDSIEYLQTPTLVSFAINNGATSTSSQTVTLNNVTTCSPASYMASENSSFSGADWQSYNAAPSFNLSAGGGTKTVYLKVKNNCGESNVISDNIDYTAGGLLVSIPNRCGHAGAEVTIPIEVGDTTGSGIIGVDLKVQYNANILTAINATTSGTIAGQWASPTQNITSGQIIIVMAGIQPLSGAGVLVNIKFRVAANAAIGSTSDISLANVRLNEGAISVNLHNGVFTVCGCQKYGDVSFDGTVSAYDAALVLQHAAELIILPPEKIVCADVSCDGTISAYDAALILQYAAEIIHVFPCETVTTNIVAQSTPVEVSVPNVTGLAGEYITIPINISDTTSLGIIGVDFRMNYDPSVLTAINATIAGTIAGKWGAPTQNVTDGQIIVTMAGVEALSGAGTLLDISFHIADGASIGDTSNLGITVRLNESQVPVNPINGMLTVWGQRVLDLYPGWNLISISLDIPNTSLASVLAPITGHYSSVWAYDSSNLQWVKYIVGGPSASNNLNTIDPGRGYLIYTADGDQLNIAGGKITNTTVQLHSGWNLVGYKSLTPRETVDALSSLPSGTCVFTYDNASEMWLRYLVGGIAYLNSLQQMEPDKAYWFNVKQDCEWEIQP